MDKEAAVQSLTDVMAKFTAYIGKRLPKDVKAKLADLRTMETNPLAKSIYDSMAGNQEAADRLNRPSCQDTGVIQYFVEAGANFPLLGELEEILQEATAEATRIGPLRHNAVETFDEKNTGTNTGTNIPWLDWRIVPELDSCTIDVYMAGGGCTLPGAAARATRASRNSLWTSSPSVESMPVRRCWSASASPLRSRRLRACPSWRSCARSTPRVRIPVQH
ncbi:Tartrate dehydratase alpha subunit/Fumarate hydratase class I N-terminal domain-like protein [Pseudogulbenkiania ferrooxidans 2002]|uniref:L(+)-tartrate dehydratase subunit alpha n=1 Tax=Pseudogulbenkiania ferrooxidans 2002 TaxID=279714 RepID=B9Z0L3_9NEIS|nr:Tartrate dehydratase alpha subunit/Fumarate hydratase class I N-terminal domain-like protein [Pseudogulbenkiania ferrooxidans 2002]